MSGKEIIKKLKKLGWEEVRTKGSHVILKKDGKICPVPLHGSKDIAKGTFSAICRLTGEKL